MSELSSLWSSCITPTRGAFPNVRGLNLPSAPRPLSADAQAYVAECAVLMLRAWCVRSGRFDLRCESIYLTMHHTLARVARGVA